MENPPRVREIWNKVVNVTREQNSSNPNVTLDIEDYNNGEEENEEETLDDELTLSSFTSYKNRFSRFTSLLRTELTLDMFVIRVN